MDDPRISYHLFVLINRLAGWRRKIFPARTKREAFYNSLIRPVGLLALAIIKKARRKHASARTLDTMPFDAMAFPNCDAIKRILIMKTDHIGDFVFALPAFAALRAAFQNAHITLLCGAWNEDMARTSDLFDAIICTNLYQQRVKDGTQVVMDEKLYQLSQMTTFDIAVDLKYEPDTRFLLGLVSARFKAGFHSPLMPDDMQLVVPLFTSGIQHMRTLLLVLAQAVIASFDASRATHHAMKHIATRQRWTPPSDHHPLIGINMGSGGTTRNWPLASFVALGQHLIDEHKAILLLFGTKSEKKDAGHMVAALGADRVLDLTGALPLTDFTGAVDTLDLYIGHDTGSTHIAASLNTPTLCLFAGVCALEKVAPTGENLIILNHEVSCMPCGLQDLSDCHHNHQCMTGITVDRVLDAVRKLLKHQMVG